MTKKPPHRDQAHMFDDAPRVEHEKTTQVREMSEQFLPDREFYEDLLRVCYEAGPRGILMQTLIRIGIERRWWQPTAHKHFGEKMRAAWTYGLLVVNHSPGYHTGTAKKHVIHPFFVDVRPRHPTHRKAWAGVLRMLMLFRWTKIADHPVIDPEDES